MLKPPQGDAKPSWHVASFLPLLTPALTTTETPLTLESPRIAFWGSLIKMAFSLAIVLGIILLIKKYLLPKRLQPKTGERVQVLSKTYLEPQLCTYLLGCKEKRWVVLSGRTGITVLDKFNEPTSENNP